MIFLRNLEQFLDKYRNFNENFQKEIWSIF